MYSFELGTIFSVFLPVLSTKTNLKMVYLLRRGGMLGEVMNGFILSLPGGPGGCPGGW